MTKVRGVQHVGPPKTRASRCQVRLPRSVLDALRPHLTRSADPDGFVFTVPQGGPVRVAGFRARFWRLATRMAGLNRLRIHDLRHTAVALWIAAGSNPKEVAAQAGHSSVSFTLDRYGHLYPESDAVLRDRLYEMFTGVASVGGAEVAQPPRGPANETEDGPA